MQARFSTADLFHGQAILWMTRWGFYCLGLDEFCPIQAVLCVDDSRTNDLIEQRTGIRVFAHDRKAGARAPGREDIMEAVLPSAQEKVEELLARASGSCWSVVSTNPCRSLEAFAAGHGMDYIGPPPDLCHWLNDKTNFLAALQENGLPRLPGRWVRLAENHYLELASEMGNRFVVQLARGISGSGTFFIGSEEDYAAAGTRCGDAPVWAAPDVGDVSFNINAVATGEGTAAAWPSSQLAGLPELCVRRGQYCGNDYAATASLPRRAVEQVIEQTERIGNWLAGLGFRGLFGLDFVMSTVTCAVFAVDLNPRWQGSTVWLAQAQQQAGALPLPAAELAWRKGLMSARELLECRDSFLQPVQAGHISLRNRTPQSMQVTAALEPGVYSFSGAANYERSGLRLNNLRQPGEMLVIGAVPRPGTTMSPSAHMLRLGSREQVLDPSRNRLLPAAESAVRLLHETLALEPVRS